MLIKTSLAALVLGAALTVPASAQDSIAGMSIPADQMESVQNHCDALLAADRAAMGETAEGQDDHEENPSGEGGDAATAGQGNAEGRTALTEADDSADSSETAAAGSGTFDLSAITLADCEEAGIAKAAE